jgi:hypothetical protein
MKAHAVTSQETVIFICHLCFISLAFILHGYRNMVKITSAAGYKPYGLVQSSMGIGLSIFSLVDQRFLCQLECVII